MLTVELRRLKYTYNPNALGAAGNLLNSVHLQPDSQTTMQQPVANHWDIFCRVIDNYGDIGVCWRLARQLAHEYPVSVRLWVDDISALVRIWPTATSADVQTVMGVEVRRWPQSFDSQADIADVVIEAFACELPPSYITAMAAQKRNQQAPRWFNLEYLSAESWVDECHGLLSMHPPTGMKKAFFFPGFNTSTGGLLRERGLLDRRQAWQTDPHRARDWFQQQGITIDASALRISLFAYDNPMIVPLLSSWQNGSQSIHCLVPDSLILTRINQALATQLVAGDELQRGQLRLSVIPWLDQDCYDELLWCCDVNFVRGEDSFVRAQWAGKPMIWQIYPQQDGAHIDKLNAFLDVYMGAGEQHLKKPLRALWHAWNTSSSDQLDDEVLNAISDNPAAAAWQQCLGQLTDWQQHSQDWSLQQNSLPDLATQLMLFCQKPL